MTMAAAMALLNAMPIAAAAAGSALSIGGALRDDNDEVWARVVALAGGPGACVAVLATAAGDPVASAATIAANLERRGARARVIPVAPRLPGIDLSAAVQDPRWTDAVRGCGGVFFSGGAQERLLDTLAPGGQPTPLLQAVRAVFDAGGVVAGTSSGAAVMSDWIFRDAPDVMAVLKGRLREGGEIARGFAFVPAGVVIDQHFLKRGRIGRLLPLMAARGVPLGIGVEEDSAIVVRGPSVEVLGRRGALIADLVDARIDTTPGRLRIEGARLAFLERGDRYDLATRRVASAKPERTRLDPNAPGFRGYFDGDAFYADILGDGTIVAAMTRLVDSPQRELFGLSFNARPAADDPAPDLGFEWRLYKDAGTLGWTGNAGDDYTIVGVRLDLRPVRMARPLYSPMP